MIESTNRRRKSGDAAFGDDDGNVRIRGRHGTGGAALCRDMVQRRANYSAAADVQRQTVFTVDQSALSLPEFGCEHANFHKSATGWVVHASQCHGADPSLAEPFSRVVHIVRHGARVRFT